MEDDSNYLIYEGATVRPVGFTDDGNGLRSDVCGKPIAECVLPGNRCEECPFGEGEEL